MRFARNERITVRASAAEKGSWQKVADKLNINLSDFVRFAIAAYLVAQAEADEADADYVE